MSQLSASVAFGAGLISFLSPCVLPLVPGYLSFVAGVSVDEIRSSSASSGGEVVAGESARVQRMVLLNTLGFVLGFSLVFVALGASATAIGGFLLAKQGLIAKIAGAVVVIFGVHMLGILRIPLLYQERRLQVVAKPAGLLGSLVVGVAFAFGWTPCIGPILAAILSLAATEESVSAGIGLLASYSLGLAIPFLATAVAFDKLMRVFQGVKRHMRVVEVGSGLLLVAVGILIMTGGLTAVAGWAQRIPFIGRLAL